MSRDDSPGTYNPRIDISTSGYSSVSSPAGPATALTIMATSLLMPTGYSTKNPLYRSQLSHPGTASTCLSTKKLYRTTSVVAHATSIDEYHALAVSCGKGCAMPQTRTRREKTCMMVVKTGAGTMPVGGGVSGVGEGGRGEGGRYR